MSVKIGLSGIHTHFSNERCSDFSWRVQSYLYLNVSVQNVHWNILFLSSVVLWLGACIAALRRRRRSFLPERVGLKEPIEPCVECDDALEKRALDAESEEVRPVSCDVVESALDFDHPDPLLEPFRFLQRDSVEGDVETSSAGSSFRARAFAMSSRPAGSFSGGECCHLSKGLSSSQGFSVAPGMAIARVVGVNDGDMHSFGLDFPVTFLRLRAFANQFAIWLGLSSVRRSSSAFSSELG